MYTKGEVPTIPKQKYFNKNTKPDTTDYSPPLPLQPKTGLLKLGQTVSNKWVGKKESKKRHGFSYGSHLTYDEFSEPQEGVMGVKEELKDVLNTGATKVVNFFEKLGRKSPEPTHELTVSRPSGFKHTASPAPVDLPNMTDDEAILEKMQQPYSQPAQESFSRPVPRHMRPQQKAQGRRLSFGGMPGVYTCDQCGGYKFKKRSRRSNSHRRSRRSNSHRRSRRSRRRSRRSRRSRRRSRRSRRSRKSSRSVKRRGSRKTRKTRKTRRTRGSSSRRSRRKTRRNRSKRSRRTVKKGGKRRSNKNQITPCD